jgi:hypothetical protein
VGADNFDLQVFLESDPVAQAFVTAPLMQPAMGVLLQGADHRRRRKGLRRKLKIPTGCASDIFVQDWRRGEFRSSCQEKGCLNQGMDTIEQLRPPAAGT